MVDFFIQLVVAGVYYSIKYKYNDNLFSSLVIVSWRNDSESSFYFQLWPKIIKSDQSCKVSINKPEL